MSEDQATVMITAHRRGTCVVAVYTKDMAETKTTTPRIPPAARATHCCLLPNRRNKGRAAAHTLPAVTSARPYTVGPLKIPRSEIRRALPQPSGQASAKARDVTTVRCRRPAIFSSRAARLTAGPMQVKSSRLPPPILPYKIFLTCSATPKRKRSTTSPIGNCMGLDVGACLTSGTQGPAYRPSWVSPIYSSIGNTASNPSPMNFRTSPPWVAIGGDLAVEILIEDIDHGLGRKPVRQRCEPAQVR